MKHPTILAVLLLALAAAHQPQADAAPLNPRADWTRDTGSLSWLNPACGAESVREIPLGRRIVDAVIEGPRVGQTVRSLAGDIGTITAAEITNREGRKYARFVLTGGGVLCDAKSPSGIDRTYYHSVGYKVLFWSRLRSTALLRFHAWDPHDEPTLRIRSRRRAPCVGSSSNTRADAWRCFVGHQIMDPCFQSWRRTRRLLCVSSPWARTGTIVIATRLDEWRTRTLARRPWAIALSHGRRCIWLSGATTIRGKRRLNYGCLRKRRSLPYGPAGYAYGTPVRRRGRRVILFARDIDRPLRWVGARALWR